MKTPSQFQKEALAGKYGYSSQVAAEADAAIDDLAEIMTAEQITEYKVLDLRNQLAFAVEAMNVILRGIANSDITPEDATARVNDMIDRINIIAK